MDAEEFIDWMAFYELEPWGDSLHGIRDATNTAAVYNAALIMSNPKQFKRKPFAPKDFCIGVNMGYESKPKRKITWQDQRATMFLIQTKDLTK